jgi:dihydropteroate synthase
MDAKILSIKNLNEAKKEIEKVKPNPVGTEIMSLKAVHRVIKFENIDSISANIIKQEMLSRGGDVAVSRDSANFKSKTTDLILMGTLAQYIRLIRKMKKQPKYGKEMIEKLEEILHDEGVHDIDEVAVW